MQMFRKQEGVKMTRSDVIEGRIGKLVAGFGHYLGVHDQRVPFTGEQLTAHRQTVALRRLAGSVHAAVQDPEFIASLRRTLLAWGIGRRASRLVPEEQFADALRSAQRAIAGLELLTIEALNSPQDVAEQLWATMETLCVVTNQAKLVAGTLDVPGYPPAKSEALSMLGLATATHPGSGCSLSAPPAH